MGYAQITKHSIVRYGKRQIILTIQALQILIFPQARVI